MIVTKTNKQKRYAARSLCVQKLVHFLSCINLIRCVRTPYSFFVLFCFIFTEVKFDPLKTYEKEQYLKRKSRKTKSLSTAYFQVNNSYLTTEQKSTYTE